MRVADDEQGGDQTQGRVGSAPQLARVAGSTGRARQYGRDRYQTLLLNVSVRQPALWRRDPVLAGRGGEGHAMRVGYPARGLQRELGRGTRSTGNVLRRLRRG